jgi:predicted DNA-binding transcriptional regulator YafY
MQPDSLPARLKPLFILLLWEGEISRGRVIDLFQLSPVRASEWIRELREHCQDRMTWDPVGRRYFATESLFRTSAKQSAARLEEDFASYLALTRLPSTHFGGDSGMHMFPDFNVPGPRLFATLKRCIADAMAVVLTYRSMRNPEPHRRVIEPHSLVRAGRRWHVRGYCRQNEGFRDFALGRIVSATSAKDPAAHGAGDDEAWSKEVDVVLVPHPNLNPQQEEVVRFENFAGTSARRQSCRAALVAYLIQDVRAATDIERQRPPDYQIAVANMGELKPWLFTN